MSVELQPYIVYRLQGTQVECAIWQLKEGQQAVALFQSAEAAAAYRDAAELGPSWQVLRPPRDGLLHLLRACCDAGVSHAVLDPDQKTAKLIFDLKEILAAVSAVPPSP